MKIKVDDLRGYRPGYTIGVSVFGTKTTVFGPFDGIESMDSDNLRIKVGYPNHGVLDLPREQEIDIFGIINPISEVEAVALWEDHVGDSGQPPTDDEIRDFANAVLRSVGIR